MCGVVPASSQSPVDTVKSLTGIEVVTSVDRADMLIGDLVTYKLTITYDSTYELVPPPLGANLGAFDVKDYQPDVMTRLPDGRMLSENVFTLSTFTTGDYVIPPIPLLFNLPDGSRKVILSESVPIKVNSLLENAGDSVDIRPLKDPYEFERDWTQYYLWGSLIAVLLIVVVVLIWRRLRRKKTKAPPVDLRPPWEIAFEKLALLKEKNLVAQGSFKEYYIELTEIARSYLGRMYGIDVMEMTTGELLDRFTTVALPGDCHGALVAFFQHADLVKFARFVPQSDRALGDLDVVHDLVESIRADHAQRQAEAAAVTGGRGNRSGTPDDIAAEGEQTSVGVRR